MTRRGSRRRRRGFTLVELMVYFALVTTAMVVFGAIQLSAQRTVDMQHALVAIHTQSQSYLSMFRSDVEDARKLRVEGDRLRIERLDGIQVIYRGIERRELDAQGKSRGRHVFRRIRKLSFSPDRATNGVRVEVELGSTTVGRAVVERRFTRLAIPRRPR